MAGANKDCGAFADRRLKVERRSGGNAGGIPVDGARVIGDGDERAAHSFGAHADAAEGLRFC